jgi:hypothetical protein
LMPYGTVYGSCLKELGILNITLFWSVDERYHVLFRNGELNLSKLLKTELGATAAPGNYSEVSTATLRVNTKLILTSEYHCKICCFHWAESQWSKRICWFM